MVQKYYLDTAIWRDLHENRTDRFRPLGDWAFELIRLIRINQDKILYSDLILDELSIAYDRKTVKQLFYTCEEFLEKTEIKEEQVAEAVTLSKKTKIPFGDALHGIIARDNKAVLVTRDKHFIELRKMVQVKKPEELI